eukprot:717019-Rhodomonas_salina.1
MSGTDLAYGATRSPVLRWAMLLWIYYAVSGTELGCAATRMRQVPRPRPRVGAVGTPYRATPCPVLPCRRCYVSLRACNCKTSCLWNSTERHGAVLTARIPSG